MKKHFSDEECMDLVRGLLPQAQGELMKRHLESGCEKCNKLHNIWSRVSNVTGRESLYEPAEPVLRVARGIYANRRGNYLVPRLARSIPLFFDSFLESSAAAVRGHPVDAPARHLLYRDRWWAVDMRLQIEGTRRISVVGQVLRRSQKSGGAVEADAILMQDDAILVRTSTNQFGEFQLESQYAKNLKLYLDIRSSRPLEIMLPDPDI